MLYPDHGLGVSEAWYAGHEAGIHIRWDISPLQEAILTNKHFAAGFQIETPEETLESLHKQ